MEWGFPGSTGPALRHRQASNSPSKGRQRKKKKAMEVHGQICAGKGKESTLIPAEFGNHLQATDTALDIQKIYIRVWGQLTG